MVWPCPTHAEFSSIIVYPFLFGCPSDNKRLQLCAFIPPTGARKPQFAGKCQNTYLRNMEFGRVDPAMLDEIDFKLPAEPVLNKTVLKGPPLKKPRIYLGCSKWGKKEWVGKIYPKGTKETDFPDQYMHHFNTVELNATHYKIYGADVIEKWGARAKGKHFKFCPKVLQSISHYSSLVNADAQTTAFLEGVLAFQDHLGPIFLQLSERFSPNRRDNLYKYLESLPRDLQFFLEVRSPEWFSDLTIRKELFDTLHKLKVGAVITDTAGRRDCCHMHLPVPKAFIRYVGNGAHPTDYTRIDDWMNRIHYWLKHGLKELFFFIHDNAFSPEVALYVADKLKEVCGVEVPRPQFIASQSSLF